MLSWASSIGAHNTPDARITHLITPDGGFLSIPDDMHDEFGRQYATEIGYADRSVTLIELPSDDVFPMFFKICVLNKDGLTKDGMLSICAIAVGVLRRYYPDHTATSKFESTAFPDSSTEVEVDGTKWTKRGFGLVFRKIFVTKQEALQLRHTVVCELNGRVGSLACSEHPWSNAIAREVYTTGMEMYGWGRSVTCTKCLLTHPVNGATRDPEKQYVALRKKLRPMDSGFDYASLSNLHTVELKAPELGQLYLRLVKSRGVQACTLCSGRGTLMERNQSPLPIIALDESGDECADATELLTRDGGIVDILRQTTIRASADRESTPGFSTPVGIPMCPGEGTANRLRENGDLRVRKGLTASLRMEAINSDVYEDDLKVMLEWEKNMEVTDPETINTIQDFIRTQMKYYNVSVKSVFPAMAEKNVYQKQGARMVNRIVESNHCEVADRKKACYLKKLLIRVQGEGSCFCGNRGEHHDSNSVYFEMGPQKCWQRCFCTDDTVGASRKTCKEYSTTVGGGRKLSDKLSKLFTTDHQDGSPTTPVDKKPRTVGGDGRELSKEMQEKVAAWNVLIRAYE